MGRWLTRGRCSAVLALSVPILVLTAAPATAASAGGALTVVSYGLVSVTPGFSTAPAFTQTHFQSTVVYYEGSGDGSGASCTVDMTSSIAETLQAGQGAGTWSCTGGSPDALDLHGSFTYARSYLTATLNGSASGSIAGHPVVCSLSRGALQILTPLPPHLGNLDLVLSC